MLKLYYILREDLSPSTVEFVQMLSQGIWYMAMCSGENLLFAWEELGYPSVVLGIKGSVQLKRLQDSLRARSCSFCEIIQPSSDGSVFGILFFLDEENGELTTLYQRILRLNNYCRGSSKESIS